MKSEVKIGATTDINLPRHVAVIMDGNGRWAKAKGWPRYLGHREGAKRADQLIRYANDIGIEELTLYAFSEENWGRPNDEVSFLMRLLASYIRKLLRDAKKKNIRFKVIGKIEKLPAHVRSVVLEAIEELSECDGMTLTLALSYSGRDEIAEAAQAIATAVKEGRANPSDVDANMVQKMLPSQFRNEPDLLIRTSGESRVSNFLLWQLAYAELVFVDVMWPDFDEQRFLETLKVFGSRERRFGGIDESDKSIPVCEKAESSSDASC